jgi:hypothetical protein
MKKVVDVFSSLQRATEYVLNSDYVVVWKGVNANALTPYNQYIESVAIPGKTIQTGDSVTANSLKAKVGQDVGFDDLEMTWRLTTDFGLMYAIDDWMDSVKTISEEGYIKTGFYDEYCKRNSCQIGTQADINGSPFIVCEIKGLYPITKQAIQFSAEGGEYIKLSVTFSCFNVSTKDITASP